MFRAIKKAQPQLLIKLIKEVELLLFAQGTTFVKLTNSKLQFL